MRVQHPSMTIVKCAGLLMRALVEESEPALAGRMQHWALSEGAFPKHLHSALFAVTALDTRLLAHRSLLLPYALHPFLFSALGLFLPHSSYSITYYIHEIVMKYKFIEKYSISFLPICPLSYPMISRIKHSSN